MMRYMAVVAGLALAAPAAFAYQVTGPVLDVSPDKIVVEKNKEKWEIARDKDTKVTGDLKKGSRVTIQYRMTATSIEAKDTKSSSKEAKETKASDSKAAKSSSTSAATTKAPATTK